MRDDPTAVAIVLRPIIDGTLGGIWMKLNPKRNNAVILLLCLGVDLSLKSEMTTTLTIAEWRKRYPNEAACVGLQNRPTVFLLLG